MLRTLQRPIALFLLPLSLDLAFRLEDALGTRIPYTRWQLFLEARLAGADLSVAITPEVVRGFAEEEMAGA